ncbi:MAG: hypothetical protein K2Q18_03840 [Bdellovibrionales bacterium]|nr:hypothetical protein [Bdellovibrionales bacterium]
MSLKENLRLQRMKKWKKALSSSEFPVEFSLGQNDIWVLVFLGCISLFMTKLLWLIPLYVMCKATKKITVKKSKTQQSEMAEAITFIETNQLKSLCEVIESNPSLLQCEYKKKTILSWCEFYHNTNAFIAVDQIRKKSQVKTSIAA